MATYSTGDKQRLVEALNLSRDMLTATSLLQTLMDDQESFDTTNSTDTVGTVLTALAQISSLETDIANDTSGGVSSESAAGEYSVSYASPGASITIAAQKISAQRDLIKRYLDPNSLLEPYNLEGRIIRTL